MSVTGQDFVQRVNARSEAFLESKREQVCDISAEASSLVDSLTALTAGGKKLRPVLAWIGWRAAGGGADQAAVERLGVALELFQAAALIHDDVIDRSATRRGRPSTHRRFSSLHAQHGFAGDAEHFGTAAAILTGDLALSWAAEAFDLAEQLASAPSSSARGTFRTMHTEVITGQYLDVLSEVAADDADEAAAAARARAVLTYKSAKYSTEYPVTLGCSLTGADADLQAALARAALPVGVAFQLRDDLLGVFGDPATTGKPVGDDLREGKRTELVAYGLFRSSAAASAKLASMLGRAELNEDDVDVAREILRSCGAVAAVESEIDAAVQQSVHAEGALRRLGVAAEVLTDFAEVRQRLVARTS
ncbi:MAG: polyprenyl synthetase family protein [Nesterenkonia sp.]